VPRAAINGVIGVCGLPFHVSLPRPSEGGQFGFLGGEEGPMQGRRAGEVLAALFGFFSAIFFAGPASAQSTTHTTISSSLNPSQVGDLVDFTIDVVGTGGCTPQLLA
jgi:hypothetical protein